jgi:hypothetical protein
LRKVCVDRPAQEIEVFDIDASCKMQMTCSARTTEGAAMGDIRDAVKNIKIDQLSPQQRSDLVKVMRARKRALERALKAVDQGLAKLEKK